MTRAAFARVYQVPLDRILLLKSVAVSTEGGPPAFIWNLSVSDADIIHYVYVHYVTTPVTSEHLTTWIVLNPGDWVTLYCDPAPIRYWVSGALLPAAGLEFPE